MKNVKSILSLAVLFICVAALGLFAGCDSSTPAPEPETQELDLEYIFEQSSEVQYQFAGNRWSPDTSDATTQSPARGPDLVQTAAKFGLEREVVDKVINKARRFEMPAEMSLEEAWEYNLTYSPG